MTKHGSPSHIKAPQLTPQTCETSTCQLAGLSHISSKTERNRHTVPCGEGCDVAMSPNQALAEAPDPAVWLQRNHWLGTFHCHHGPMRRHSLHQTSTERHQAWHTKHGAEQSLLFLLCYLQVPLPKQKWPRSPKALQDRKEKRSL